MFEFDGLGDIDFQPGDELEFVTAIRLGDTVCMERVSDGKIEIRALSEEEAIAYDGTLFRAEHGSKSGSFRLTTI